MHDESFCHKRKTFVPRKKKKKEKGEKKAKNFFIKNFHSENREDHAFFFHPYLYSLSKQKDSKFP